MQPLHVLLLDLAYSAVKSPSVFSALPPAPFVPLPEEPSTEKLSNLGTVSGTALNLATKKLKFGVTEVAPAHPHPFFTTATGCYSDIKIN